MLTADRLVPIDRDVTLGSDAENGHPAECQQLSRGVSDGETAEFSGSAAWMLAETRTSVLTAFYM